MSGFREGTETCALPTAKSNKQNKVSYNLKLKGKEKRRAKWRTTRLKGKEHYNSRVETNGIL